MKKFLVTGGAGFIGSHVCDSLLENGDSVVCVDNFNDYYDSKIKERNIESCLTNDSFKLYRVDITNISDLTNVFEKELPQVVIHLAARAGVRPSIINPFIYEEVNVKGTLNLLELTKQYKVKNFVFGSSSSVYGINEKIPFSEDDPVNNPISPYAATKRSAELLCSTYHHLYDMDISCLRFFTVYGPRGRPDMAPYKFTKLIVDGEEIKRFGDGSSKRDYTYVSDIVDGILAATDLKGFEIINLGNNNPVELNYFISVIEDLVGKKAKIKELPIQPGDVNITYADISKAKSLFGYNPKTSIGDGMAKFWHWYKENN